MTIPFLLPTAPAGLKTILAIFGHSLFPFPLSGIMLVSPVRFHLIVFTLRYWVQVDNPLRIFLTIPHFFAIVTGILLKVYRRFRLFLVVIILLCCSLELIILYYERSYFTIVIVHKDVRSFSCIFTMYEVLTFCYTMYIIGLV